MLKKASFCLLTSLLVAALLFVITLLSCSADPVVKTKKTRNEKLEFSENQIEVLKNSSELGFNLLKQINSAQYVEENIFVSPFSISVALQVLLNGAENESYDEIEEVLGLDNPIDEVNQTYEQLLKKFVVQNSETNLILKDSIFLASGVKCKSEFLRINTKVYGASANPFSYLRREKDDYQNFKTAVYSKNKTSFQSLWKHKFDLDETIEIDFKKNNGDEVSKEFMTQRDKYSFYKDDLLSYAEIPYGSDSLFSMTIILPSVKRNIDQVINELDNRYWNYIIKNKSDFNGQIFIPKFTFSYNLGLKNVLMKLGLNHIFSNQASFRKISTQNIFVEEIKHKATIAINEKGLQESRVSAIEMVKYSIGSNFYLVANRPFVFLIKENLNNEILFVGKLVDP